MLYTLYEMQHAAFAPVRMMADQGQKFFRQPYNPLAHTPYGRVMAASFDMIEQLTRRYGKPAFCLPTTEIDGKAVEVVEEIVARKPFGQLIHFTRKTRQKAPRVLVVAPMSGHFATLLRGTVEALLPDCDVYITDWRDARDIPVQEGSFDLDDYVEYLISWLEYLGPGTHMVAVCQPSVPVYAATALMEADNNPAAPVSVTMMGGPVDTRRNPTEVNNLATTRPIEWFEQNVITVVPLPNAGFMRKVYPGFLQLAGFMTMNLGDHFIKHQELFEHLVKGDGENAEKTKAFYEEYRSVMDMTAEFYLQTIEVVFQKHLLPKGEWVVRGKKVDPKAITRTYLMAVEGELDDISGLGQTKAALEISENLPESRKKHYIAEKVGHYGIFNGQRWRSIIAPEVKAFMRKAEKGQSVAPAASVAPQAVKAPEAKAEQGVKAAAPVKPTTAKKAPTKAVKPAKVAAPKAKSAAPKAATPVPAKPASAKKAAPVKAKTKAAQKPASAKKPAAAKAASGTVKASEAAAAKTATPAPQPVATAPASKATPALKAVGAEKTAPKAANPVKDTPAEVKASPAAQAVPAQPASQAPTKAAAPTPAPQKPAAAE